MGAAATATLQFLGGAATVTGSKFLIRSGRAQFLLDAGLFQGLKELRLRNWAEFPFDPSALQAVVLSHAHIDHSGALPLLVRSGFRGKIFCTSGTADLLRVMLPDAAHLQEEEASYANRHGTSKHKPALPLYTLEDVRDTLRHLEPHPYGKPFSVGEGVTGIFRRAGHIVGSATVEIQLRSPEPFQLVFSGDLGRWNQPILRDPEPVPAADALLLESTYGDRTHEPDPAGDLARIVKESAVRGGALLIPAFAVGRTQTLVWMLRQLEEAGRIPSLPVYVDSPMAINVADIYCRHTEDHDLDMQLLMDERRCPLCSQQFYLARNVEESKAINDVTGPAIIISSSGMMTGGRILHHLKLRLPDPRTTVLLVGFQAAGTRGRSLQEGASTLKIFGQTIPVKARVEILSGLSAHADQAEILRWLSGLQKPPRQVYIVHGEPEAAQCLAEAIHSRFHWNATVAGDGQIIELQKS